MSDLEPLMEATWGDVIPWQEFPSFEGWDGAGVASGFAPFAQLSDREEGRFRPYYENEQDLARQLGTIRRFLGLSELPEAVTTALRVYIFGAGVETSVQAAAGTDCPPELVEAVKRIVEGFIECNGVVNNLDVELHQRSREDGEAILPIERVGNRIVCNPVETVQLTEPRSPQELYDWIEANHRIDCHSFVPSWLFGVLTSKRHTSEPIGYHVVYDSVGNDWEFYPASQMLHIKRNVPRAAKRGVSDWLAPKDTVLQWMKLKRNIAHGTALQAAIAWVEESPTGTTNSQLPTIGGPSVGPQVPNGRTGTRTERGMTYGPGSILRPSNGRLYKPFLQGTDHNAGFAAIEEMLMRTVGTRWLMTYPMISGDASQVNFAASLTAEAPFVKAREADQQFYGGALKSLFWKVVRYAWQLGWLDTRGVPMSQLGKLVDIKVDFTSPATRDRTALVDQLVKEVGLGATSVRTASVELGRDYDEELAAGAKAEGGEAQGQPGQQQPGAMAGLGARQSDVFRRNVIKILGEYVGGKYSRTVAAGMLASIGVSADDAEKWLTDAEDGALDESPELTEAILEAWDAAKHPNDPDGKYTKGGNDDAKDEEDYRGTHRAPSSESGAPLYDMTGGGEVYPDDIYSSKAAEYYGHFGGRDKMDVATMRLIHSLRGKPDAKVTIYRAVPKSAGDDIKSGDWITINPSYAKYHGEGPLQGDYKIIKKVVTAKDIYGNGDSIHEYGYSPPKARKLPESITEAWDAAESLSPVESAAVSAALESVETTDEARQVLESLLLEAWDPAKHPNDPDGKYTHGGNSASTGVDNHETNADTSPVASAVDAGTKPKGEGKKMTNSREMYRQMEAAKDETQIRRENADNGVEQQSLIGVSKRSLEHSRRWAEKIAKQKAETKTVADKYAAITARLAGRVPYLRIEGTVLQYSLSRFGSNKMRHDLAVKSVDDVVASVEATLAGNGM